MLQSKCRATNDKLSGAIKMAGQFTSQGSGRATHLDYPRRSLHMHLGQHRKRAVAAPIRQQA
jgi:hypothetical protein